MSSRRAVIGTLSPIASFATAVLAVALLHASPTAARESDLRQPIDVSADRSEYDQRSGTQTLIGNVEIRQGTMRISAERVAISLAEGRLARIEGSGSPIRFEQENDDGGKVTGEARTIAYDATNGTLVLTGGATLSQPGQSLSSERIAFDARSQRVSAEGGENEGRVTIRLDAPPAEAR